jgi:prevent-host-death family protein
MIVNSTEVQNNFGKYLMLVAREDIIITKNGREVAKLTTVDYIPGRANYMDAAVCEETAKYLFNNRKATYKEFLELTKESQYRYEFIDGEIYLLSSPRFAHQWAMKEIFVAFCNWFEGKKCVPMAAPYDLTLWRDESTVSDSESDIEPNENDDKEPNIVQPDIMVICDLEEKLNDNDYYMGVPALVVEIVSESTRRRDYVKKLDVYMSCGVNEYWIVNPINESTTIYLFKDREIQDNVTFKKKEIAKSYIFEGLSVELEKVFR